MSADTSVCLRDEMLEPSHALTRIFAPSSGGKGGKGLPAARSVPASIEVSFGGNGGKGEPSAYSIRAIVTGLPAERLTDGITGSTIKTEKTETATASAVFFMGVTLLKAIIRRDSFGGVLRLKMFRMRNTGRHENAYTVPAKPPSHSGLHTDNSCGHSWAICSAGLPGFLAGSLQRPL